MYVHKPGELRMTYGTSKAKAKAQSCQTAQRLKKKYPNSNLLIDIYRNTSLNTKLNYNLFYIMKIFRFQNVCMKI